MSILKNLFVAEHYAQVEFIPANGITIKVDLTPEQRQRFVAMCEDIYVEQQKATAELVARPLPMLADFTEAEAA